MSLTKRLQSHLQRLWWRRGGARTDVPVARGAHSLDRPLDERLFDEPWRALDLLDPFESWGMPVDVRDEPEHVTVSVEVPGYDPSDLDVSMTRDRLIVSGTRRGEHGGERAESSMRFEVDLPAEVTTDDASATVKHGLLTVRLPKTEEARRRTKRIQLTAA